MLLTACSIYAMIKQSFQKLHPPLKQSQYLANAHYPQLPQALYADMLKTNNPPLHKGQPTPKFCNRNLKNKFHSLTIAALRH